MATADGLVQVYGIRPDRDSKGRFMSGRCDDQQARIRPPVLEFRCQTGIPRGKFPFPATFFNLVKLSVLQPYYHFSIGCPVFPLFLSISPSVSPAASPPFLLCRFYSTIPHPQTPHRRIHHQPQCQPIPTKPRPFEKATHSPLANAHPRRGYDGRMSCPIKPARRNPNAASSPQSSPPPR
jgi:hypothetical protein